MPIRARIKPILTDADLVSIQSATSDPRLLINILSTLARKIGAWRFEADSLIVTDASGRKLAEIGSTTSLLNNVIANHSKVTVNTASTGVTNILNLGGSGILRKIAVRVVVSPGTANAEFESDKFATDLPLLASGLFTQDILQRAVRFLGTGTNVGDMFLIDSLDLDFQNGLKLDVNVTTGSAGSMDVYVWYDSVAA